MKKILLALFIIGFTAMQSFAQSRGRSDGKFSIGFEAGLPTGDAHHLFGSVLGGSLKYELPIDRSTWFTISAGYNSFQPKGVYNDIGGPAINAIPLKVGVKYYFDRSFFAEGQIGAAFFTGAADGTAFAYSPGIGYTFSEGFELGLRYEGWSKDGTLGQAGLRLAYRF